MYTTRGRKKFPKPALPSGGLLSAVNLLWPKPYLARRLFGRLLKLPQRIENLSKLAVVLLFQLVEPAGQVLVRGDHLPQAYERPHDGDVDGNGTLAPKHAR